MRCARGAIGQVGIDERAELAQAGGRVARAEELERLVEIEAIAAVRGGHAGAAGARARGTTGGGRLDARDAATIDFAHLLRGFRIGGVGRQHAQERGAGAVEIARGERDVAGLRLLPHGGGDRRAGGREFARVQQDRRARAA